MANGDGSVDAEPYVAVHDLSKRFRSRSGTVDALDGVSFEVARGELVVVVGPSGCGKSTLLSCIAGLERPTAGSVSIQGEPVAGPSRGLGMVFQEDMLLPWRSALRNVTLPGEVRRIAPQAELKQRAQELLRLVGLARFADKYPAELSGGMRQRVAICRALIHDPSLLLLDEPFGALDALTREQLNLDLRRIHEQRGVTIVLVTHSIPEAVFLADRILVMSPAPGRVVETIDVDLPRPRDTRTFDAPGFGPLVGKVRACFEALGVLSSARAPVG
ncbi:MAG TPA: ABC transporter ATP-binding protein [Natronosporangium sp.]